MFVLEIVSLLSFVQFTLGSFTILEYSNSTLHRHRRQNGCILPQHPENGQWSIYKSTAKFLPGESLPSGSILQVGCHETYKLDGDAAIVCINDKWTTDIGQCLKTCPPIYSSTNMKVTCTYNNQKSENCTEAIDGTVANFECADFYEDVGLDLHPVHLCFNGRWSHNKPECVPKCGQKATKSNPTLIVNATDAPRGDYPWQIALYNKTSKELLCGGSLLNQRVVLTAAHCITNDDNGKLNSKETYMIAVGKYYRNFDHAEDIHKAQFSEIHDMYIPRKYKGHIQNFFGDIAIIITKKIFFLSDRVQPVCIDWGFKYQRTLLNPNKSKYGYVSGWGYTVEFKNPSEVLKHLKVPIITNDQCDSDLPEDYQKFMTDDKICAGFLNQGTAVCRGDSGGALVTEYRNRYYAVGVVSLSPQAPTEEGGCDSQQYTLFTSVYYYINELILEKEARFRPSESEIKNCEEDNSCQPDIATTTTTTTTTTKRPVTQSTTSNNCVLPEFPKNGKWSIYGVPTKFSPGQSVSPSSILEVTCNKDFKLDGNELIICRNGKWSPEIGKCLKHCPSLESTPTTIITCTIKNNETDCNNAPEGTVAKYICAPFYEDLQLSKNPVRVCRNGSWDLTPHECVPVCGQKSVRAQTLIVNGEKTKYGEYPWQTAIFKDGRFVCSGALISENLILTAAHCVRFSFDKPSNAKDFIIGVGKHSSVLNDTSDIAAQFSKLKEIIISPHYVGPTTNYVGNIAILVTERNFTMSYYVQPVCLDWTNSMDWVPNLTGIVTGWGFTASNTLSRELQQLKSPVVTYQECDKTLPDDFKPYLTFDKFCSGYIDRNASVCKGDSGGPLVVRLRHDDRYYIRGIVSSSQAGRDLGCRSDQYTLYTNVSAYQSFILENMAKYRTLSNADCDNSDCQTNVVKEPSKPEVSKYNCILPEHPQFGKWSLFATTPEKYIPGRPVTIDTVLQVFCQNGYKLDGNSFILCDKGKWSSSIGKCLKTCSTPYSSPIVQATCLYNGKEIKNCTNPIAGTQVKYQCAPFYEDITLAQFPVHNCIDGTWDRARPNCIPVCGIKSIEPQPLIVGGTVVPKGDYPWTVALYHGDNKDFICGGTLISSRLILTGATCVTDSDGSLHPKEDYTVAVGKYYSKYADSREKISNVQFSTLDAMYVPDLYRGGDLKYLGDLAILVTSRTLKFTKTVQPACVDWVKNYENSNNNLTGYITGWGYTASAGGESDELRELEVPLISNNICKQELPKDFQSYLIPDKLCAGYKNKGTSACRGDSGGGLVVKFSGRYYITGILSLAPVNAEGGCDTNQYALYTKISSYIDFIKKKINEYDT